jgi:hypothetical protein
VTREELEGAPGPCTIERDDSLPMPATTGERWRVVEDAARERRRKQGSSARPAYVATVYRREHAVFFARAAPAIRELLRKVERLTRERDEAREALRLSRISEAGLVQQIENLSDPTGVHARIEKLAHDVESVAVAWRPCDGCGNEYQASRVTRANPPFVCGDCEMYARGYASRDAEVALLEGELGEYARNIDERDAMIRETIRERDEARVACDQMREPVPCARCRTDVLPRFVCGGCEAVVSQTDLTRLRAIEAAARGLYECGYIEQCRCHECDDEQCYRCALRAALREDGGGA